MNSWEKAKVFLMGVLATLGVVFLVGARSGPVDLIEAKKIMILNDQGNVTGILDGDGIQLTGSIGAKKYQVIDDNHDVCAALGTDDDYKAYLIMGEKPGDKFYGVLLGVDKEGVSSLCMTEKVEDNDRGIRLFPGKMGLYTSNNINNSEINSTRIMSGNLSVIDNEDKTEADISPTQITLFNGDKRIELGNNNEIMRLRFIDGKNDRIRLGVGSFGAALSLHDYSGKDRIHVIVDEVNKSKGPMPLISTFDHNGKRTWSSLR